MNLIDRDKRNEIINEHFKLNKPSMFATSLFKNCLAKVDKYKNIYLVTGKTFRLVDPHSNDWQKLWNEFEEWVLSETDNKGKTDSTNS